MKDPSLRTDRSAIDATCNGEHQQKWSIYNIDKKNVDIMESKLIEELL